MLTIVLLKIKEEFSTKLFHYYFLFANFRVIISNHLSSLSIPLIYTIFRKINGWSFELIYDFKRIYGRCVLESLL